MRTLRDPNRLEDVSDPAIRQLLALRFAQLGAEQPYDPDEIGHFVLVESGDSLAAIEAETGCWLVSTPFADARYGEADYSPLFEFAEEHPACYEVGFIFNDGGYGIVLIVPKADADAEVLGYCQQYATTAPLP